MESAWLALIVAVITSTLAPAILLLIKNRSDRDQRREDADIRRAERAEDRAREDARDAKLNDIKKQTDGVVTQVAALAKSTGRIEGHAEATKEGEATAATLLLGQQQGRDAERESIATQVKHDGDQPLPVVDKITNETGERSAKALESMASTAQEAAKKKE